MIHKSGLMTGGHDSRGAGRKWDEQEVVGAFLEERSISISALSLLKMNVFSSKKARRDLPYPSHGIAKAKASQQRGRASVE